MADYRERLAARVIHEREKSQLSREELALKASLNPKTIERIEEQKIGTPRGNTIRSLAKALGVEADYLNPPSELEEERLERLEEKVDEILLLLRRVAGDDLAEEVARLANEARAEAAEQGEKSPRTPAAVSS